MTRHTPNDDSPVAESPAPPPARRTFRRSKGGGRFPGGQSAEQGVALVITLIMLTIITVIAIAFLAVTHRERTAVKQKANSTDAEYAGNTALERAKAQILARIYNPGPPSKINPLGPDFEVSRDYINPLGFNPALPPGRLTNVSYWYANGQPVAGNDALQNLVNLQIDPRPPVFINTNQPGQNGPTDFRYFIDLNRNGTFEPTGFLRVWDDNNNFIPDLRNPGAFVTNYLVGDPQWIGILERPNQPHGPDNYFIGRYAFITLPIGRSLDMNWIHNQAMGLNMNSGLNGYSRNQGFGSWELNLAAVLADVNTNQWIYGQYDPASANGSVGSSFNDARDLLGYRYTPLGTNWPPPQSPHLYLSNVVQVLPSSDGLASWFTNDNIDGFGSGPVSPLGLAYQQDPDTLPAKAWQTDPWPGADGHRHFYTLHDFFDPAKSAFFSGFRANLEAASARINTYDRYTYYRMASVLGTDSGPDTSDKINLNYVNIDGNNASQFISWDARKFFTNVADRLLKEEYGYVRNVGIHRIPIYTNGASTVLVTNAGRIVRKPLYSPRVHQLLQVAANIWEATVRMDAASADSLFPTVFRPQFEQDNNGDVFIAGYTKEVQNSFFSAFTNGLVKFHDLDDPADRPVSFTGNYMFYGIPFVISAKRGFPNFNEFAMQTVVKATRRLEFRKGNGWNNKVTETNQMLLLSITNSFGVEAWNSYFSTNYPRNLNLFYANSMRSVLTNEIGVVATNSFATNASIVTGTWAADTYRIPPVATFLALPVSVYRQRPTPHFDSIGTNVPLFERVGLYTNQWGLSLTNKLTFGMFDNGRIIDFVSFANLGAQLDISGVLADSKGDSRQVANLWGVRPIDGLPEGLYNQIQISLYGPGNDTTWKSFAGTDPVIGNDVGKASLEFAIFLGLRANPDGTLTNELMQAPYTASRAVYHTWSWQVNDPLVHYTLGDLETNKMNPNLKVSLAGSYLGVPNENYQPWLGRYGTDPDDDVQVKDPGVESSDQWNFPAQKLPNIGWLGRVHRGTPWQTIYLKSAASDRWAVQGTGGLDRSIETHPTNDWRLLDIFTTAQQPNSTRGQLSINQTNVAAWTAVLAGVPVTTLLDDLNGDPVLQDYFIEPAAKHPALLEIVDGINRQRQKMPRQQFSKLSELMATPQLTVASPFIDPASPARFVTGTSDSFIRPAVQPTKQSPLVDADYERIPQQILSLVKVGGEARYVVYAFGQSLRPAKNSIYTGTGAFNGLCQNYEITGEIATRAVVRVGFDKDANDRPNYARPHAVVESFNILPTD